MKKYVMLFSVFAFLWVGCGFAVAGVLNFEDLTGPSPSLTEYQGFTLVGAGAYEKPGTDDGNYRWDGTHGTYSIYANTFGGITLSRSTAFSLDSLYVTTDADGYTVSFTGWLGGHIVAYADNLENSIHSQPYFVNFASVHTTTQWDQIDRLDVLSGYGGYLAHVCLDDITYDSGSAAVPLPPTLMFLGAGLFGLAGLRRRLKK